MTEQPDAIQLVDEKFWLGWGAKTIESTATRIDEGANKVAAAMAWFWGAYTAVVVAIAITQRPGLSSCERVLVSSPAVLLFAAYALATWATLPQVVAFDARQPWAVKTSYDTAMRRKRRRLRWSVFLATVAAIAVAVTTFLELSKAKPAENDVAIQYIDTSHSVLVGGTVAPNTEIVIEASSPGNDRRAVGKTGKDGAFQEQLDLAPGRKYTVTARWESPDHYVHTISKTVDP